MAVLALCVVCTRPAFFACGSCGRAICDRHYNARTGLCSSCEGGRLVELPPV